MQILLTLLFVTGALAQCAQDALGVRNQFQVATNKFGVDLTLWHRLGQNLVGDVTGNAALNPPTDAVISDAQSLTTTSANTVPSVEELEDDRDRSGSGDYQFVWGRLVLSGDVNTREDVCSITVGAGPTGNNGFCLTSNGNIRFPLGIESQCTGTVGNSGDFEIYIRRYLEPSEEKNVLVDLYASYNGVTCIAAGTSGAQALKIQQKFGLEQQVYSVGAGITLNEAPTGETATLTSFTGASARIRDPSGGFNYEQIPEELVANDGSIPATSIIALGRSTITDTADCAYETWTTSDSPVIPGSGDNNFQLTWTVTNFGPSTRAADTGDVRFTPAEFPLLFLSNYTSVAVTGGSFDASTWNGLLTTGGAHTVDALDVGQSSTFTITATLGNCSATALPRTTAGGALANWDATSTEAIAPSTTAGTGSVIELTAATAPIEAYIQRVSKIRLIETDQRDFQQSGLPIAAGCGLPFEYTLDIFNEGPSCAENLEIETQFRTVGQCTDNVLNAATLDVSGIITTDGFDRLASDNEPVLLGDGPLFPNTLNFADPTRFVINADADSPNIELLPRKLYVTRSQNFDDRYSSIDTENDDDDDDEVGQTVRVVGAGLDFADDDDALFDLTYDIKRYSDLKIRLDWEDRGTDLVRDDTVVAGFFRAGDDYNLRAIVTVTNVDCVPVRDTLIDIDIELPEGVSFIDIDTNGQRLPGVHVPLASGQEFAVTAGTARVVLNGNTLTYNVVVNTDFGNRAVTVAFGGATNGLAQTQTLDSTKRTISGSLTVDAATIAKLQAGEITLTVSGLTDNNARDTITGTIPPTSQPALVRGAQFSRYIQVGGLLRVGESRQYELDFQACHNVKAVGGGVRVSARVVRAGDYDASDGNLHVLETEDPPFAPFDPECGRVKLIRLFDDLADDAANVIRAPELDVTAECDEPELITRGGRLYSNDDDDDSSVYAEDVELQKITRCRITASNNGRSDATIKIRNYWDLPLGTQVGKWKISSGVFVDNDWTVTVPTVGTAFEPAGCPARTSAPQTLEVDLVSTRRGTIQWVAMVQTSATADSISADSKLGNSVTVVVD